MPIPLFHKETHPVHLPPPQNPALKKNNYNALRRIIIYLFILLFSSILLTAFWLAIASGYLASLR